MNQYVLLIYGFGKTPEEESKSLGRKVVDSYLSELSVDKKFKDERLTKNMTLVQFITFRLPWEGKWQMPKPNLKLNLDYFGVPLDVNIRKIKERKNEVLEAEDFIYQKSFQLKMMDERDYEQFMQKKKSPSRIYALNPKFAAEALDDLILNLLQTRNILS